MNRTRSFFVFLGVAGLIGGCVPGFADTQQPTAVHRAVLLCDRDESVTLEFEGDAATLVAAGSKVQLVQQPAASGIHYSGEGHDLRGKGADLVWTDSGGGVHHCRDQRSEPMQSLAGTSWRLVQLQSSDDAVGTIVPPNVERYSLEFMADGTLAMQLDCNRANARWKETASSATGGSLEISPGAMTRAMCASGAIDTRLARDLSNVRSYALAGGRLSLVLEAGGTYLWERTSAASRR